MIARPIFLSNLIAFLIDTRFSTINVATWASSDFNSRWVWETCTMKLGLGRIIASVALAMACGSAASASLIVDNFEGSSASNYTVATEATPDGTSDFAFDYVAAGLPLAPNSAPGGGRGLRFTANTTVPTGIDAYTAFHNTFIDTINTPQYLVTVDVYMGFAGTSTTEFAAVGVGGNGLVTNKVGPGTNPATGQSGSGSFLSFSGDGAAARDYLWYLDTANGGVGTVSAVTAAGPPTFTISPTYLAGGAGSELPLYNSIFPGTTPINGGSPSNRWTTVGILVDQNLNQISYSIGGTIIVAGTFTGTMNGRVSLGYADLFPSVAPGLVFGIFDNLSVTAVPEPSTFALLAPVAAGAWVVRRRRLAKVA